MTTIYISLAIGAQEPAFPAWLAFRSPYRFVSGATVVLPEPAPVALAADGTGTVSVDPGVWLVDEILPTSVIRRAIVVPQSDVVVQYSSLAEVVNPVEIGYGPTWAATAVRAAMEARAAADSINFDFEQITQQITATVEAIVGPLVSGTAPLDSPAFTGSATAPTLSTSFDNDRIATTAFVHNLLEEELSDLGIAGTPSEGAIVAYVAGVRRWVVPEEIDTSDIPYASGQSAKQIIDNLVSRVIALETSGPTVNNTALPVITGTGEVGQVLTVSNGSWSQTPDSYTRQWKRDGVAISGATNTTYTLTSSDIGTNKITCTVTAIKSGYTSGSATSAARTVTAVVIPLQIIGSNGAGGTTASATRTVVMPPAAAGDLYLVAVASPGGGSDITLSDPGFVDVGFRQVSGHNARLYAKVATGSEAGTTLTVTNTTVVRHSVAVWSNRSAAGALSVYAPPVAQAGAGSGLSAASPSEVIPSAAYEQAVLFLNTSDTTTALDATPPAGFTVIREDMASGVAAGRGGVMVAYPTLAPGAPGATIGGDTFTWDPGSSWTLMSIALVAA